MGRFKVGDHANFEGEKVVILLKYTHDVDGVELYKPEYTFKFLNAPQIYKRVSEKYFN